MKNNKKGFTLAELLIVVAIIAVLTAIAIPIFTSQLERSREATDISNIRSYYAEVNAALLTGDLKKNGNSITVANDKTVTLTADIPAEPNTPFTITVPNVNIQQSQNNWQTASFEIAGITGGSTVTATDKPIKDWTSSIGSPCNVTFSYTLAADGDIVLTGIAFASTGG